MNLNTEIDIKGFFLRWAKEISVFARKTCERKPKSPVPDVESSYRSYQTRETITRDPTLPAVITGHKDGWGLSGCNPYFYNAVSGDLPKPPISWFLSGVPEEYHKHYVEWMTTQNRGSAQDFNTYLSTTGQFFPSLKTGYAKINFDKGPQSLNTQSNVN